MTNSTLNSEFDQNITAGVIIFIISFSGAIFNILAMIVVLKSPILRNAFGAMCFSHTIANFGVLFVFVFYVTPSTIFQYQYSELRFGKILGQINILFWNACCYSHLAISLNRFISISMPTKVSQLYNFRNTILIILLVWCLAFCHISPYFWAEQCYVAYNVEEWVWEFPDTECGYFISTYTDYYSSVLIFIVMSCLDFGTFALLVAYNKKTKISSNDEAKRRARTEIRFFTQSCLQGVLFFYEVFMFYYVCTLNTDKWYVFFTTTFAWELCHCLDGLVVVIFHFRRSFFGSNSRQNTKAFSKDGRSISVKPK
ncbi:unnamed protein product [Caenorhabditis angaria]|uniref:G-protein coupled receptors family 1 profile domain-containing protein n=1 Tax=Caenorhabditis angaria TaxID=860376 RepID=A0A9P1N6G8_9PELO|nr:unnamed protein product [Caenorhabditis angaria]